jgi:hypothetical protein
MIVANAACPARAMLHGLLAVGHVGDADRSAPTAKMNGLPVMPTAWISPAWARAQQAVDGGLELGDRGRAEGVGLGVVEAVVEGDQGHRCRRRRAA